MPFIFQLVVTLAGIVIVLIMPKRLTPQEIYTTWLGISTIAYSVDVIFGGVLGLYYYLNPRIQIFDVLFQFVTFPLFGVIVLNFMPNKLQQFILYSLVWMFISVVVEYISVKMHVLIYSGWRPWYSPPFYLLGCCYLRWHLSFIRREVRHKGHKTEIN